MDCPGTSVGLGVGQDCTYKSSVQPCAVEISAAGLFGLTCNLTEVATCGKAQLVLGDWLQVHAPHCGKGVSS